MRIRKVEQHKQDFLPLLLLADDGAHLEHYLENGTLFVLETNEKQAIGVALLTEKNTACYEIENFGISEGFQGQGFGRILMREVLKHYEKSGRTVILGTDDVSGNVQFYEKCGFEVYKAIPDYFIENYNYPIFENGIQLKNKIYLRKKFE